jgi:hypothetical protein
VPGSPNRIKRDYNIDARRGKNQEEFFAATGAEEFFGQRRNSGCKFRVGDLAA